MGRIAFVFSGQGDQYPGMGKDLYEQYDAAKNVFQTCEEIRPGTMAQCFQGTEEELKETKNTQPCLFAMELAAEAVLLEKGIRPEMAAGFSLGEVSAATAAGIFDCQTGFRLVIRRGELMQQAAEQHETFMAAVVKLPTDTVKEICSQFDGIYPVNYNCPGQVTVSGLSERQQEFSQCVKDAGGRAIVLKVKGAFHSPFMREASAAFAEELKKAEIKKGEITLYSNMTAKPYTEDVVDLLSKQICSPVEWEMIIRSMIAEGIDTFIEIGPGKTLSNMIKKIDDSVKVYAVAEMETLLAEIN